MEITEKHKKQCGLILEDFKKDDSSIELHRILAKDCHGNWLSQQLPQQRRLYPTMMEVNEKEVIKWLDVDIIFSNELFLPSETISSWRIDMDYKRTQTEDTSTMIAQMGVSVPALAHIFLSRIVTRWRVQMDYKKYRKRPSISFLYILILY